jgi:hypothetical protein
VQRGAIPALFQVLHPRRDQPEGEPDQDAITPVAPVVDTGAGAIAPGKDLVRRRPRRR